MLKMYLLKLLIYYIQYIYNTYRYYNTLHNKYYF